MAISTLFHLHGYKGSNKHFGGAFVITHEPIGDDYMTGAWNYAIRQTAPGFDVVDYDKALDWLREHHPQWIVSKQDHVIGVNFARGHNRMEYYDPPSPKPKETE